MRSMSNDDSFSFDERFNIERMVERVRRPQQQHL